MKARAIPTATPSSTTSTRKWLRAQAQQQPVISVDTKKKELIGNFKNGGTDYRPKGDPQRVNVHDFEDKKLGKVVPYGVYDVTANAGLVSVGITSDTAEFAVASIRCWLERMGRQRYPQARDLTITADCGGSNGARLRLWKVELQKLADETGLVIHVHHYPPGTSKWNKIEHRLFCHITQNWRGRPLTDRLAVVELIGATTTKTGLKVESVLDTRTYQKGIKVEARIDLRYRPTPTSGATNTTLRERSASRSSSPRLIVERASPLIFETSARPPRPALRTSAAANSRRPRSSSCEPTVSQRNRIAASSIMRSTYAPPPLIGIPNI